MNFIRRFDHSCSLYRFIYTGNTVCRQLFLLFAWENLDSCTIIHIYLSPREIYSSSSIMRVSPPRFRHARENNGVIILRPVLAFKVAWIAWRVSNISFLSVKAAVISSRKWNVRVSVSVCSLCWRMLTLDLTSLMTPKWPRQLSLLLQRERERKKESLSNVSKQHLSVRSKGSHRWWMHREWQSTSALLFPAWCLRVAHQTSSHVFPPMLIFMPETSTTAIDFGRRRRRCDGNGGGSLSPRRQ